MDNNKNFIQFNEVSGDICYVKRELIDGIVLGEAKVPVRDENGEETGEKENRFFVSCLLNNNRQTGEAFDTKEEQLLRFEELKMLIGA